MWRALTVWVGMIGRGLVAWVALALALAFVASPWRLFAPTEGGQDSGFSTALHSQPLPDAEDSPSPPSEEPMGALLDLFEDDEVVHHKHDFVLVGLRLEAAQVVQLEPGSLHTREFERPPLRLT